jgi:hypoxanthine phosphoribosyltransferase
MVKEAVRIHDKVFEPLLSPERIRARVQELAGQIAADYADKTPLLLPVLNGAFVFAADLFRQLGIPSEISFVKLSSYNGLSGGPSKKLIGLNENIGGRHVLVVEDIVDTGDTMKALYEELGRQGPASLRMATLLFKPSALRHDLKPDYAGFEIGPEFVVGYGLDYNGRGRDLPGIYILRQP